MKPASDTDGKPVVLAFDACSWGDGVLSLLWGGQTILRMPSVPPETGFWNAGDVAVACRSHFGQGKASYRIVLSGELANESRQNRHKKLGFHLQANIRGSYFRILKDAE